jgi:hypothetical protein
MARHTMLVYSWDESADYHSVQPQPRKLKMRAITSAIVLLSLALGEVAQAAGLTPRRASDVVTVQVLSNFPQPCPTGGLQFNRRVQPPTVVNLTIPADKVWVVTSIDWEVQGAVTSQMRTAFFSVATATGVNGPAGQSTALADGNGHVGASVVFPTGIVVRSDQLLCFGMKSLESSEFSAVAHGFLAPDK